MIKLYIPTYTGIYCFALSQITPNVINTVIQYSTGEGNLIFTPTDPFLAFPCEGKERANNQVTQCHRFALLSERLTLLGGGWWGS